MKKFIVPVLSVCFFMSCSSDDQNSSVTDNVKNDFLPKSTALVANVDNAYDYSGKLHADVLAEYLTNFDMIPNPIQTVMNNVDYIVTGNSEFMDLAGSANAALPAGVIVDIIDTVDTAQDIISATHLSPAGKAAMSDFITMLDDFETQPYNTVNKDIKVFEVTVTNNILLTNADIKSILCTTSIARYSIAANYPRKRSWTGTKSGIIASIAAASPPQAIALSVTVNISVE